MTSIILNGGLGNQLFQLAAALDQSSGNPVLLDQNLGRPRLNAANCADISDLISGSKISLTPRIKPNFVLRKVSTLAIRESAKNRTSRHLVDVLEILSSAIFSLINVRIIRVRINCGIGFDQKFQEKTNSLNIGYFQTFHWASRPEVKRELMLLSPEVNSEELTLFSQKSKIEKILAVHVRLTDFRLEDSFGIPSKRYYEMAIEHAFSQQKFDRIMLFSDEPDAALDYIPEKFADYVEVVGNFPGGVAETFEAMRMCHGYVIGNSTFSWWGAFLTYGNEPLVIAPARWFKSAPTPRDLIPKEWIQFDPHFHRTKE